MKKRKSFIFLFAIFAPFLFTKVLDINSQQVKNSESVIFAENEPVVDILEDTIVVGFDSISFDYIYKNTNNDPLLRGYINVEHAYTTEKENIPIFESDDVQSITLDSSTTPNISYVPNDSYHIIIYTQYSSTSNNPSDYVVLTLSPLSSPEIIVSEINSNMDSIEVNYTYNTGIPIGNEKGFVDIRKDTTGPVEEETKISLNPNETSIVFNSLNNPSISFELGDKFELRFYTEDATNGFNEDFTKSVTLNLANPEINIIDINSTNNSISVNYEYIQGTSSYDEKGFIKVEKIIEQGINEEETIELSPGPQEITINNSLFPNIYFNPGDEFILTFFTTGTYSDNVTKIENISLSKIIEKPKIGIEANYINYVESKSTNTFASEPTELELKLYFEEQNDASTAKTTFYIYDEKGNQLDRFIDVNIGSTITIDLTKYSSPVAKIDTKESIKYKLEGGNIWYQYDGNVKRTGNAILLAPSTALYDSIWFWVLIGVSLVLIILFLAIWLVYLDKKKNKQENILSEIDTNDEKFLKKNNSKSGRFTSKTKVYSENNVNSEYLEFVANKNMKDAKKVNSVTLKQNQVSKTKTNDNVLNEIQNIKKELSENKQKTNDNVLNEIQNIKSELSASNKRANDNVNVTKTSNESKTDLLDKIKKAKEENTAINDNRKKVFDAADEINLRYAEYLKSISKSKHIDDTNKTNKNPKK